MELQNPYYLYPGYPCCGYDNFKLYNENLQKLKDHMDRLERDTDGPILLHITIGAAMEECNDPAYAFQWRQLYPYHLENVLRTHPDTKIVHLVISPNVTFEIGRRYVSPRFVELSDTKFFDDKHGTISALEYDFTTTIYCTMMPTKDNRNSRLIDSLIAKGVPKCYNIDSARQTSSDVAFIADFYRSFSALVKKVKATGGCVTAFSFAVFNESTDRSSINNYAMFKEIRDVFGSDGPSSVLCEWRFYHSMYVVTSYSAYQDISYIKPVDDRTSDSNQIIIKQGSQFSIEYVPSSTVRNELYPIGTKIQTYEFDESTCDSLFESVLFASGRRNLSVSDLRIEVANRIIRYTDRARNIENIKKYPHLRQHQKSISDFLATDVKKFTLIYAECIKRGQGSLRLIKAHKLPEALVIGGSIEIGIMCELFGINIIVLNNNDPFMPKDIRPTDVVITYDNGCYFPKIIDYD